MYWRYHNLFLIDWLTDWLIDWLIDWMLDRCRRYQCIWIGRGLKTTIHVKICITPHYSLCRRRSSIKHGNFFDSGMNVWRIRNLYFFLFNLNEHQYVNAIEFIKLNIWHFFKFWWNMFLVEGVDLLLNS